ncbi:hypothetical protein BJY01DRAFT_251765 [Aspergillus pseudoustus]|uniref:G domain-containing protein n=1 Tax=Aspergillus pseudoustus TaxID=1810923 RepID=A0ABR4J9Z6_9EURO
MDMKPNTSGQDTSAAMKDCAAPDSTSLEVDSARGHPRAVSQEHFHGAMGMGRSRPLPRASDVYIAVMGVTGAGKSTFISHLADEDVVVGNGLHACTQEVQVYRCKHSGAVNIWLVDTPGFDDTHRSDTEVLREIAEWLSVSFSSNNVILNGMIYLHRITDIRMQGSAMKNLFMFKKLCGRDALKNVILTTTMWEQVGKDDGERREQELIRTSEFWGEMILRGAQVKRHHNTDESAWRLVDIFAATDSTKQKEVLNIQTEMVVERKPLGETDAGLELENSLIQERKKWSRELKETREMMREALAAKDKESVELLLRTEAKMNEKIEQVERAREQLKADMQKMHEDHVSKFEMLSLGTEKQIKEMRKEIKKNQLSDEVVPQVQPSTERHKSRELVTTPEQPPVLTEPASQPHREPLMLKKDECYSMNTPPMEGRVTLSLSGNYYFFCGPKKSFWEVKSDLKATDQETAVNVCLGTNGSWYRHYHVDGQSWTERSGTLEVEYPGLEKGIAKEKLYGCPETIALGDSQSYYFSTDKRTLWCLADIVRAGYVALKNIKNLWLGKNDSFVLVKTSRQLVWDLRGQYGGLEELLKNAPREGKTIQALALNLENSQSWAVLWKEGGAAWCSGGAFDSAKIEHFLRENTSSQGQSEH